jgi:hypothetical protein
LSFILTSNIFNQPIIILSAPRAGSTLLFELLAQAKDLWTIGGESHAVIEGIPQFCPGYQDSISNVLTENDGDEYSISLLKQNFQKALINRKKQSYSLQADGVIRFLEKTPKNSLRIRFLNKVFPDAKFIYLVRDPKENISSILDAWNSKSFITYPNLPEFKDRWSLILLPNWPDLKNKSNAEIATWQWKVCNETILNELKEIPNERWQVVNYQDLILNPDKVITKTCEFIGVEKDQYLTDITNNKLPLSEFTLTKPQNNKWHKNADLLFPQMSKLTCLITNINKELFLSNAKEINNVIDKKHLKYISN